MKTLCAAIFLVLAAWSVAGATPVELTNEKFSLDIPDSWSVKQQPVDTYQNTSVLVLSATNAEKTCALEILVCNNPRGMMADEAGLISNVKDSISNMVLSHGGQAQFTSESKVSFSNVPAYLIQYTITNPSSSRPILARAYQLAANGKLYLISMRTVDAAADADLAAIANSISFATPPELPKPPVAAHRIRYFLMAGVGAIAVIAAVVGVVIYRRRQDY